MSNGIMATKTKSSLWTELLKEIDRQLSDSDANPKDIIQFITKFGCYTFPRTSLDPQTQKITSDYLAWLDENGTPLESFPGIISESDLVHPDLVFDVAGRRVSTMFLFHLCIAMRLQPHLPEAPKILEIGGGYGGLARLAKLLWPECTYTIVDLDESLKCSGLFLKQSFPNASIHLPKVDSERSLAPMDFALVSAGAVERIKEQVFDITINTCSFGEMTQSTVDLYHDLFEGHLETRYLYSINRFGHRPFGDLSYQAPRDAGVDTSFMPLHPSARWDVRIWDCWNETGIAEIELAAAPYLEVLFERVSLEYSTAGKLKEKAALLLQSARNQTEGTPDWHYAMFNALRYYPTRTAAETYLAYLKLRDWPEALHFQEVLRCANADLPAAVGGKVLGNREILLREMKFTRLRRTYSRRIGEQIAMLRNRIGQ